MTDSNATANFTISDGHIISPGGAAFVARGIAVMQGDQPSASTIAADFPGTNFVRLAMYDYNDPAAIESYVNSLTANNIVVEIEDHTNSTGSNAGGNVGTIFTGQELQDELDWYSALGSEFQNNPYVWFGTDNEPSEVNPATGQNDPSLLSQWQQETYNAIRDTGNNSIVLLEANTWAENGQPVVNQGYDSSVYSSMTNVVWDEHYYGWLTNGNPDQATNDSFLQGMVQAAQTITSADGTIPVIFGEYGNSSTGMQIDSNGAAVVQAVQTSGYGSAAWVYANNNPGDALQSASGNGLSAYGHEVANFIAGAAAADNSGGASPTTTPDGSAGTTPSGAASADNTVVTAGSTGSITDASGNVWTIVNGVVQENGSAAGFSAGATEIVYIDGAIWQENNQNLWWSWQGTAWSNGSGVATSPVANT